MPNQTNIGGNLTNEQKAVHFDLLVQELARVTAELNAEKARVAELVEQLKAYGKYAHDTTLEDQNAELAEALEEIWTTSEDGSSIESIAWYALTSHRAKQEVKS